MSAQPNTQVMARNLFVLSLLSIVLVGCFGPEKAPSPVNDGGAAFNATLNEPSTVLPPIPAPAPKPVAQPAPKPPTKTAPGKRLPIGTPAGNK